MGESKIPSILLAIAVLVAFVDAIDSEPFQNLVMLLLDLRNKFHINNIFIARSNVALAGEFEAAHKFSAIMKRFAENNVFSMLTTIKELPKALIRNGKKADRLLLILIIRSTNDFDTYANITKMSDINFYHTLILFSSSLDEFCQHPVGNPFNLNFESRVLIKCQKEPVVREWYSLYENKIEVSDLFYWESNLVGFVPLTNLTFYKRRSSLKGITLRTTTLKDLQADNKLVGYFGDIVYEISHLADFKLEIRSFEEGTTAVLNTLTEKKADIGVGEFTITSSRTKNVTFSDPIYIANINFYVKKSHSSHLLWEMYYKAFGVKSINYFLLFFFLSPVLLALIVSRTKDKSFGMITYDCYFDVWGIFCSKSPSDADIPKQTSGRIAYYSLYLLAFVMYAVYSALLVSYLTIFKPDMPFDSVEEFVMAKTHKITTIKNTSFVNTIENSKGSSTRRLSSFLLKNEELPSTLAAAINQVCSNTNLVLYMTDVALKSTRNNIPCELISFERTRMSSIGLTFTKHSPYVGLINFHLQRMRNFGLLDAIRERNFKKSIPSAITYKAVDVWSIIPLFGILTSGAIIALILIIAEKIIFIINHRREKSS